MKKIAKILSVVLCLAMVLSFAVAGFATEATGAVQVTDVANLAVGDQIVLGNQAGTYAMGAQDNTKRLAVAATAADGVLALTDEIAVLTLEAGAVDGSFALKAADGYLTYNDSGNKIWTVETLDECASWTITIEEGIATITNVATTERLLQFNINANQERFVCYKGTMENPVIYKLDSSVEVDPPVDEPPVVEPPVVEPEAPETVLCDTVEAGKAYKFGMVQQNVDNKIFYLAGGMNGYYMETTENAAAAIDVYLEETEGGYYLYTMENDAKLYINMVVSGTHVNGAYEAEAATVYTFDAESKTLIATVNDAPYWFGTRNDKSYTTVGPVKTEYNGFYCQFYTVVEEEPPVVEPPVVEPNPGTGDSIVFVAMVAFLASAALIVLVQKKRAF